MALAARCNQCPQTPDARFIPSKPVSQPLNRHISRLRSTLKFLSFHRQKGTLPPNFNKIVKREYLIMEVQQFEDFFGILGTNLHYWLNVLFL
jgi:hypothetical protein